MIKSVKLKLCGGYFDIVTGDGFGISSEGMNNLQYEQDGIWNVVTDPCAVGGETVITLPRDAKFRSFILEISDGAFLMDTVEAYKLFVDVRSSAGEVKSICGRKIGLSVGRGSMRVGRCDAKDIKLDCGWGSIDINLVGNETAYSVACRHGMGEVMYNLRSLPREYKTEVGENAVEVVCGRGRVNINTVKR